MVINVALCHRIPRVRTFYAALSLLLISLLIQAACVGLRSLSSEGGRYKVVSVKTGEVLGYAYLETLSGVRMETVASECDSSADAPSSCSQNLCSLQFSTFDVKCVRYLSACYGTSICVVIALVFSIISFVYCLGFSWGKTLLQVDISLLAGLCLPCSFLCAVLILFFTSVVPAGESVIAFYAYSQLGEVAESGVQLSFFRGTVPNLYISSSCFCFAAFIIVLCHGIWWIFFEAHPGPSEEEFIKDDYLQQKEVLTSHAKAVRAEIKFKGEIDPAFIRSLTTGK